MGGMWVDYKQATNRLLEIFAAGEAEYQYTGRTAWARTRWCRAFTADWFPARQRSGCPKRLTEHYGQRPLRR